jgi:hypothetical protein
MKGLGGIKRRRATLLRAVNSLALAALTSHVCIKAMMLSKSFSVNSNLIVSSF